MGRHQINTTLEKGSRNPTGKVNGLGLSLAEINLGGREVQNEAIKIKNSILEGHSEIENAALVNVFYPAGIQLWFSFEK